MPRVLETILFEIETSDDKPKVVVEGIIEDGAEAQGYTFEEMSVKEEAQGVEAAYKLVKT